MKDELEMKKLIKIRYNYLHISWIEIFLLCMEVLAVFIAILIITYICTNKVRTESILFAVGLSLFFTIIPLMAYLPISGERRMQKKEAEQIKANGTVIIGEIISLKKTQLKEGDKGFTYSYNVEYANPDDGTPLTITTPSIIEDNMMVKKEDLPIKVVVYVWGEKTFVDSLINPPYKEMWTRKVVKWAPIILGTISLILVSSGLSKINPIFDIISTIAVLTTVILAVISAKVR